MNKNTYSSELLIICLPYAGGSGFAFQSLEPFWPKSWKIKTLTYPGRGQKIEDALLYKMEELVEDCWLQIKDIIHTPYLLFGHSLGGRVAYLLAHKAKQNHKNLPTHLFISGTYGPSVLSKKPYRYSLPKMELKAILKNYGAIQEEILNDEDAFDFFEPIIRADFQVAETWQYSKKEKLSIPTTVITGTEEDMKESEILLWQKEFDLEVNFKKLSGNHFFLFDHAAKMVQLIEKQAELALRNE